MNPGNSVETGRRNRPLPRHSSMGWGLLAAACAVALLFSFSRAVQVVVSQGTERRAQTLNNANAQARCNTIANRKERDECRAGAR